MRRWVVAIAGGVPLLDPYTTASRSLHPGGVNTLFADGSVRFIKDTINLATWRGLSSTRGGEVISSDAN